MKNKINIEKLVKYLCPAIESIPKNTCILHEKITYKGKL